MVSFLPDFAPRYYIPPHLCSDMVQEAKLGLDGVRERYKGAYEAALVAIQHKEEYRLSDEDEAAFLVSYMSGYFSVVQE